MFKEDESFILAKVTSFVLHVPGTFSCSCSSCVFFFRMKGKLMVPRGWLNYQAPEILKVLSPFETCDKHYTFQSDIYAFG